MDGGEYCCVGWNSEVIERGSLVLVVCVPVYTPSRIVVSVCLRDKTELDTAFVRGEGRPSPPSLVAMFIRTVEA